MYRLSEDSKLVPSQVPDAASKTSPGPASSFLGWDSAHSGPQQKASAKVPHHYAEPEFQYTPMLW